MKTKHGGGGADRIDGEPPRIVVVGAGPGGLATALLLAAAGMKVTIVEKDEVVGGRTRTFTTQDGYRFDLGPTFFLYPRILADIFETCGERLEDHVDLKRLDPQYHLVFEGGGEMRAVPDRERLEAEVAKLCPADARNVGRFIDDNRAKLAAFRPVLEQSFCRPASIASPSMLGALRHLRPHLSVDGDLRRYFSDPRVRLAFSFQTKYLGMSPFRCPSLFTILSFLEHEHGVFHPMGGCGAVSDAMAALARKMGVEIKLDQAVERIVYDGDRPSAVVTTRGVLDVDAVVVNGDFGHAVRRLVPEEHRRRWPDAKIDRARLSCSTFMLYLGIAGDVGPLEHHTILLSRSYERNIADISDGFLSEEPSIYVQNAGRTDPGSAPPGHSSLYVLVPTPNLRADIDWRVEAPRYRALVLDRLKALGLPDLESRIRYEKMVTPNDWLESFAVNEGATFNLSHDLGQMLYFRPHNRMGPGLYLAGGGTHPGSGLPVIYEGARITAGLLIADMVAKKAPRRGARRWLARPQPAELRS